MTYREELERIARKHDGILHPADVVREARDPRNILHDAFEWDDTAAAEAYRIEQAKQLIRVQVITIEHRAEPVRAFVSLSRDRAADGGYRITADVISDEELYQEMCADAAEELLAFKRKYARIGELRGVFAAGDRFIRRRADETAATGKVRKGAERSGVAKQGRSA